MKKFIVITLITLVNSFANIYGQTLPAGSWWLENQLRRSQLIGQYDSNVSFFSRPLRPEKYYNSNILIANDTLQLSKQLFRSSKDIVQVDLLPLSSRYELDSHHPYGRNNNGILPSRGFKSKVSIGVYARIGPLHLEIRPEYHFNQNLDYEGFSEKNFNTAWTNRYVTWNRIDSPENFGDNVLSYLRPGNSSVFLQKWGLGLGVSTQNIWWGPGKFNSLMFTNNAKGFEHISLGSMHPMNSKIGNFEFKVLIGKLTGSGHDPTNSELSDRQNQYYVSRVDDTRNLSALLFSFNPKWIPGLYFGLSRSVQQYSSVAKKNNDYLSVFSNLWRKNDPSFSFEIQRDQIGVLFLRWNWEDAKSEIYIEYGRNDGALNLRDFLLSPEHARAFIVGLSKIIKRENDQKKYFVLDFETIQLQQSVNYLVREAGSWYVHHTVRHGWTNGGQVLGASIGPGGNQYNLRFTRYSGFNSIGLLFERLEHDKDFFYRAFEATRDFRRYWVDYVIGVEGFLRIKSLLVGGEFKFIRALNYQWEIENAPNNMPYFVNGRDVSNLHFQLNAIYTWR